MIIIYSLQTNKVPVNIFLFVFKRQKLPGLVKRMSDLSSRSKCIPVNKQASSNRFVLVQTQDCFWLRKNKDPWSYWEFKHHEVLCRQSAVTNAENRGQYINSHKLINVIIDDYTCSGMCCVRLQASASEPDETFQADWRFTTSYTPSGTGWRNVERGSSSITKG